ncbi:uncharacterized protein EDB93DRAFT_39554 [Suillus bovinus]|uniref:uncharacterized protein n=1 Tax=Suillus bovinus TaxID=48563 RepID=UPI001B868CAF|nr:uncharacterized protein EDB93DRAFT_39554 [Suillus bovinus]KAG2160106.1 hypothetical protein EDB93DRAFT_39554 [Suillus bovinus]
MPLFSLSSVIHLCSTTLKTVGLLALGLKNRWCPDAQGTHHVRVQRKCSQAGEAQAPSPSKTCCPVLDLEFFVSELRLRGDAPILQPHQQDGDVFCWNGEVFEGLNVNAHENDGAKLFQSIHAHSAMDDLPCLLGRIEGPYAFVYYHVESPKL